MAQTSIISSSKPFITHIRAVAIQLPDNMKRIAIFASRYDTYRDTLFGLRRNFEIKKIYTIRGKQCLGISVWYRLTIIILTLATTEKMVIDFFIMYAKYIFWQLLLTNKFLPYRNRIPKLPHDTIHVSSEKVSWYDTISTRAGVCKTLCPQHLLVPKYGKICSVVIRQIFLDFAQTFNR